MTVSSTARFGAELLLHAGDVIYRDGNSHFNTIAAMVRTFIEATVLAAACWQWLMLRRRKTLAAVALHVSHLPAGQAGGFFSEIAPLVTR